MDLAKAVLERDLDALTQILAARPQAAHDPTPQGVSPLALAVYMHFAQGVEALRKVVEPDVFEAAMLGESARCIAQLQDPGACSSDGFTALHLAAHFGHAGLVSQLVEHGCAPDVEGGPPLRNRPLHAAAAGGSVEAIQALLAAGASLDGLDGEGNSALMVATAGRYVAAVRMLLEAGADATVTNRKRETARTIAADHGYAELAELLG